MDYNENFEKSELLFHLLTESFSELIKNKNYNATEVYYAVSMFYLDVLLSIDVEEHILLVLLNRMVEMGKIGLKNRKEMLKE